jgi:ATP-dependent exoDNAse (exonuclease V) beta subunit
MGQETKAFRIYDASAGSGKTFTLAREYLKLLLRPGAHQAYRHILAITFTNKAVGELKERILKSLMEFSKEGGRSEILPMFLSVKDALGIDAAELRERSKKVLQDLLHNYAFFDVSTSDRFNHRVLRTFAQDLELQSNFEVVLDTDSLLMQAVDILVSRAGTHPKLTETLIEFALEKAEQDRSWDVSRDLFEMGKLLFDENHYAYLEALSDKEMDDFLSLRNVLVEGRKKKEEALVLLSREVLSLIDTNQLEFEDFKGRYFPKFIEKIAGGDFNQDFDSKWKREFGKEPLYPKKTEPAKQQLLDELQPNFTNLFEKIRQAVHQLNFLANAYQNFAPFTLLGLLQKELKTLRDEGGFLPISSFNAIIAEELKDQPAPYIYERLGERYRHYFIDEFQDTSRLQWTNLIPLISNALQGSDEDGQQGSLVLVGDAKQAIYRWRGGKAEQFLGLIDGRGNPFALEAYKEMLPKNFRSHRPLVEFNNDFFTHISSYMNQGDYASLFREGSKQLHNNDQTGLVSLDFIEKEAELPEEKYLTRILEIIEILRGKGFAYRDICILTRRRKEGVLISNTLIQEGIPVISSETLLLKQHPGVQFLIHLLNYLLAPEDDNHAFGMLFYLSRDIEDRHSWISENLRGVSGLLNDSYGFNPDHSRLKPVYDLLEEAIRQFDLGSEEDAYLMFLLDLVMEVGQKEEPSVQAFLDYWRANEDRLSILAPEGFDSITLMTIHKSKGLEFPVVIYPFADTLIYYEKNPKIWLPVDPDRYAGFKNILVGQKKALLEYEPPAPEYYTQEQEKMELDAFNLLYVAHTRAVKALYVISRGRSSSEPREGPKSYGDLYTLYLREKGIWEEGRTSYTFGALEEDHQPGPLPSKEAVSLRYTSRDRTSLKIVTQASRLWDPDQTRAMQFGTVLHYALSLVSTSEDITPAVEQLIREGLISVEKQKEIFEILSRVVEHPLLIPYFSPGSQVRNELEILAKNGLILRPDRLVFRSGGVTVMDYKTGQRRNTHREQVQAYCQALRETGRTIESAIIIYIDQKDITPEFI